VHDKLSNGRRYKMLRVLDYYTREALRVAVKPKMNSAGVLDALYPLLLRRVKPEYIRSDNGSDSTIVSEPSGIKHSSANARNTAQKWLIKMGLDT
jgi:hypothetical protein